GGVGTPPEPRPQFELARRLGQPAAAHPDRQSRGIQRGSAENWQVPPVPLPVPWMRPFHLNERGSTLLATPGKGPAPPCVLPRSSICFENSAQVRLPHGR